MGCNCKKKRELDEKYGNNEQEALIKKVGKFGTKTLLFLITAILMCVLMPVLILCCLYVAFFKKNKVINLPNFLSKHLK